MDGGLLLVSIKLIMRSFKERNGTKSIRLDCDRILVHTRVAFEFSGRANGFGELSK